MALAVLQGYPNPMDVFKNYAMDWYIILTVVSFAICIIAYVSIFIKLIRKGSPQEYSEPIGKIKPAVIYSFTGGMSPKKKESAYLHLPTYTAGIIYHLGTFLSILLLFFFLFKAKLPETINLLLSVFLLISGICGIGILIKRMIKKDLRSLSNPDDYISNILVTGFHFISALNLMFFTPWYFVLISLLLLYLPIGKLKHSIYFFAARYHLGFFYGRRGVWPPKS